MARRSNDDDDVRRPVPPPATTLEGREDQLIASTYDLVEQRIAKGTASAAETVHFLKAGSRKNQHEMEKLEAENRVLVARVKEMESRKSGDDLLARALEAFRGYSGQEPIEGGDDDSEFY